MKKIVQILKVIKDFLFTIGWFIIGLIVVKKFSEIGKSEKNESWKPFPGSKDKVIIKNEKGKDEVVRLPKDSKGNQVKNDEIVAVGKSKGVVHVEIIHDH